MPQHTPDNAGGFGDVEKAAQVFVRNELTPLQEKVRELNVWSRQTIINVLFMHLTLK